MTMTGFWQEYWSNYGPDEALSEADLFKQVAHTVGRHPIPNELMVRMLAHIATLLRLSSPDHLLDFCCGNGLFSYRLATQVARLTGVDFVPRNIHTARLRKSRPNTTYVVGDATAPLCALVGTGSFPNKFLMHYSLAYFTLTQFETILINILRPVENRGFLFLLTGIPNVDLKWIFYNTPERRTRHLENEKKPENSNDGLGRWWHASEIGQICHQRGLAVLIENQPPELSNYRMNALISSQPAPNNGRRRPRREKAQPLGPLRSARAQSRAWS
jgi:SAM-dependent methyltransferase